MSASDYNFFADRSSKILRALRMVGGLSEGHVLSAYQDAQAKTALNTLVKSWHTKGIFLWTEKVVLTSTVAGDANYAMPVDSNASPFISIDKAFIRENSIDTPLEIKSWRDYQEIGNKADQGKPSILSVDIANSLFYLHLVPDAVYSVYTFGIVKLKDFETAAGNGDFDGVWDRALVFGLAKELSFEYPMPANEKNAIAAEAEVAFLDAKKTEIRSSSDVKQTSSCYPSRRNM